jgi:hypothetical protein
LYIVYIPTAGRYFGDLASAAQQRAEVLAILNSESIPVIDVYPIFQASGDPQSLFPFRRPGHANEHGHRLIAETVMNALATQANTPIAFALNN